MKAYSNGLFVLLFFLLSWHGDGAPSAKGGNDFEPDEYRIEDLTIVDSVKGATLKIGMTREEIERLYKKDEEPSILYENYEGLGIFFRDDLVASFKIAADNNTSSRFKTARGIGLGNGKKDVVDRYGQQYALHGKLFGGATSLSYRLALEDGAMKPLADNAQMWMYEQENLYVIDFGFFDSKNELLSGILIGDWKSIYQMS